MVCTFDMAAPAQDMTAIGRGIRNVHTRAREGHLARANMMRDRQHAVGFAVSAVRATKALQRTDRAWEANPGRYGAPRNTLSAASR